MTDYNRRTTSATTALGPNAIAALVGALVVLISAFLPWTDVAGETTNSNNVPFSFLWDSGANTGLKLLIPLLIVVILIVVGVFVLSARTLTLIGAVLAIIFPILFLIQRSDLGDKIGADVGGFAPWLCLIGGLVALVGGVMGYARRAVH